MFILCLPSLCLRLSLSSLFQISVYRVCKPQEFTEFVSHFHVTEFVSFFLSSLFSTFLPILVPWFFLPSLCPTFMLQSLSTILLTEFVNSYFVYRVWSQIKFTEFLFFSVLPSLVPDFGYRVCVHKPIEYLYRYSIIFIKVSLYFCFTKFRSTKGEVALVVDSTTSPHR